MPKIVEILMRAIRLSSNTSTSNNNDVTAFALEVFKRIIDLLSSSNKTDGGKCLFVW